MSGPFARAGALFVAPAQPQAFAPPRPHAAIVGVLADPPDLLVVAGAQAGQLRREAAAAFVLVCLHGIEARPWPSVPAAARAASRLQRRGVVARSAGALCLVGAADTAAAAAALGAPLVIAASRRDAEVDALLAGADRLVLAQGPDSLLTDLAAEDLARLGPTVTTVTAPAGLLARQAARLGLAATITAPEAPERCAA